MAGCRDCHECTEAPITALLKFPFRFVWVLLTFWNVGLFQKRCPSCGHRLSKHARRPDGAFKD